MKPIKKFRAKVLNGKLTLKRLTLWNKNLKLFEGKGVEVAIQRYRNTRTNNQNRYYWGVVIPLIAQYCGYDDDEAHSALKIKFLSKKGIIPTVISTTKLDTLQFIEYIDKVKRFAAEELNLVIPDPEEIWQDYEEEIKEKIGD